MLVVNTAFQRLAWLDDEVLAIEATTSTRSSASFTDDQMSIDDLDSHTVFWQSIPNTLLFETNPHTHPNADSHSSNVNYHYIVSAQKRFIRFYQSVYYLAANATIPSCQQRSILPLPRALQKVPQAMAASDLEAVLIYGPGSPTPILPSVSTPLYPPGASTRSPSETGIDLSRRAFTAPLTDVVSDRTFFAKVVADVSSVAIAGEKKHDYAMLRQPRKQANKKRAAREGRAKAKAVEEGIKEDNGDRSDHQSDQGDNGDETGSGAKCGPGEGGSDGRGQGGDSQGGMGKGEAVEGGNEESGNGYGNDGGQADDGTGGSTLSNCDWGLAPSKYIRQIRKQTQQTPPIDVSMSSPVSTPTSSSSPDSTLTADSTVLSSPSRAKYDLIPPPMENVDHEKDVFASLPIDVDVPSVLSVIDKDIGITHVPSMHKFSYDVRNDQTGSYTEISNFPASPPADLTRTELRPVSGLSSSTNVSSSPPELSHDSLPNILELYREQLRDIGIKIRLVNPEEMDRIVGKIVAGIEVRARKGCGFF